MDRYWEKPEYRALLEQWKDARLVGIIVREGCKTLEEFCQKFDTREMLRIPNCGEGTVKLVIALAGAHDIPLVIVPKPVPAVRGRAPVYADMNGLFLYSNHHCAVPGVTLKIGSKDHGRRVLLSPDETYRLACKLMSYARGGETETVERFI